jgi:hypothetical protein
MKIRRRCGEWLAGSRMQVLFDAGITSSFAIAIVLGVAESDVQQATLTPAKASRQLLDELAILQSEYQRAIQAVNLQFAKRRLVQIDQW